MADASLGPVPNGNIAERNLRPYLFFPSGNIIVDFQSKDIHIPEREYG